MNSCDKIQEINKLIEQLIEEKNKYYITNICIEIVEITFDARKNLDTRDIRILKVYDACIEILSCMQNTIKTKYSTGELMIAKYRSELEKL